MSTSSHHDSNDIVHQWLNKEEDDSLLCSCNMLGTVEENDAQEQDCIKKESNEEEEERSDLNHSMSSPTSPSPISSPTSTTHPNNFQYNQNNNQYNHSNNSISQKRRQHTHAHELFALRNKFSSFNSEVSFSSASSIDSILELRKEDPEEVLLSLGFGYSSSREEKPLNRIPKRFLETPSNARGVNLEIFLRNHCNFIDVSNLTSASNTFSSATQQLSQVSALAFDARERSFSLGKRITNKREDLINNNSDKLNSLKNAVSSRELNRSESTTTSETPTTSDTSSLHRWLVATESILEPANREFLESQGQEEIKKKGKTRLKKLIIGTKSYNLDIDDDPLDAFPKTPSTITPSSNNNENISPASVIDTTMSNPTIERESTLSKRVPLQRQKSVCDEANMINSHNESINLSMNTNKAPSLKLSSTLSSNSTYSSSCSSSSSQSEACPQKKTNISTNCSNQSQLVDCDNAVVNIKHDNRESKTREVDCQTETCQTESPVMNAAIESAFLVAIQSIKLSIGLYHHQSLKIAQVLRQLESSNKLNEEEKQKIETFNQMKEQMHQELLRMSATLNEQINLIKNGDQINTSFDSQATTFNQAVKKMTELLQEQEILYSLMASMDLKEDAAK